ncbi:MAG: hypothetical protein WC577_04205 [Candidatus Paceibacterota bacterium]
MENKLVKKLGKKIIIPLAFAVSFGSCSGPEQDPMKPIKNLHYQSALGEVNKKYIETKEHIKKEISNLKKLNAMTDSIYFAKRDSLEKVYFE